MISWFFLLLPLSSGPLWLESGLDSDGDGLEDSLELTLGTSPWDIDSDDDGLSDSEEHLTLGTDPLDLDSDGDGIQDGTELGRTSGWTGDPWAGIAGTEFTIFIPDQDPVSVTDPLDDDFDDDGMMDGEEDLNANGKYNSGEVNPIMFDTDLDGLSDGLEMGLTAPSGQGTDLSLFVADLDPTSTTNPRRADTDRAGLEDGLEDQNQNGAVDAHEIDPRDPLDDELALLLDPFVLGSEVAIEVYQGAPRAFVFPCWSLHGAGPTSTGLGVDLALSDPIRVLTPIRLNGRGRGTAGPFPVPTFLSLGDSVWVQGIELQPASSHLPRTTNPLQLIVL